MLGWKSLAKGFMCGRWTRADGEGLAEFELGESNAADWRDMQLRRAYCDRRRDALRGQRAPQRGAAHGVRPVLLYCHYGPVRGSRHSRVQHSSTWA